MSVQPLLQLISSLHRSIGVIGGVFVCMGYAIRITSRAVTIVSGSNSRDGEIALAATGVKVGLRQKWSGGHLRSRSGKILRQGGGWAVERGPSYSATPPLSAGFGTSINSQYLNPPGPPYMRSPSPSQSGSAVPQGPFGVPSLPSSPSPGVGNPLPPSTYAPLPYSPTPPYGNVLGSGFTGSPGPPRSPIPGPPRSPALNSQGSLPSGPQIDPPPRKHVP
jgi:hypothetical protein